MSFGDDLNVFEMEALRKAEEVTKATGIEIFGRVIMRTPVDTGRLRGNWQATRGARAHGTVDTDDPGPVNDIGAGSSKAREEMIRTVVGAGLGDSLHLTNNLPYAGKIEYGHSKKQAPAGMVRLTVAEFQDVVKAKIK